MSKSRICAIASLALLAPACGGTPAAGVRATGSGGAGLGASGGASGSGPSSGATGGAGADSSGGVDALAPYDGGGCTDDAGGEPHAVSASGTFAGGSLNGAVCANGAFAYVESTPASDGGAPTVALYIDSTVNGQPGAGVRFTAPVGAVAGEIHVDIGLPEASAGTYELAATCGSAVLIATLPTPDASVCAADAGDGNCPTGCELTGPLFDQVCTPLAPQLIYVALADSDCVGDSTTPLGSWTLTLTSVTPYPADAGAGDSLYYAVHGTLAASLADQTSGDQGTDGGAGGVTLDLAF